MVTVRVAEMLLVRLTTSPAAVPGAAAGLHLLVSLQLPAASAFQLPPAARAVEQDQKKFAATKDMTRERAIEGLILFIMIPVQNQHITYHGAYSARITGAYASDL